MPVTQANVPFGPISCDALGPARERGRTGVAAVTLAAASGTHRGLETDMPGPIRQRSPPCTRTPASAAAFPASAAPRRPHPALYAVGQEVADRDLVVGGRRSCSIRSSLSIGRTRSSWAGRKGASCRTIGAAWRCWSLTLRGSAGRKAGSKPD